MVFVFDMVMRMMMIAASCFFTLLLYHWALNSRRLCHVFAVGLQLWFAHNQLQSPCWPGWRLILLLLFFLLLLHLLQVAFRHRITRPQRLCLMHRSHMLRQRIASCETLITFRQRAKKRFLSCMAPHMCSQRIRRSLAYSRASATFPFAGVAFFTFANMVFVDVFDEIVRVEGVTCWTSSPFADCDLGFVPFFVAVAGRAAGDAGGAVG